MGFLFNLSGPELDCPCASLSKAAAEEELVGKIARWGGTTNIKVGAEATKTSRVQSIPMSGSVVSYISVYISIYISIYIDILETCDI